MTIDKLDEIVELTDAMLRYSFNQESTTFVVHLKTEADAKKLKEIWEKDEKKNS